MKELLIATVIVIGVLVRLYIVCKRDTGKNFFKDLFDDMCGN